MVKKPNNKAKKAVRWGGVFFFLLLTFDLLPWFSSPGESKLAGFSLLALLACLRLPCRGAPPFWPRALENLQEFCVQMGRRFRSDCFSEI